MDQFAIIKDIVIILLVSLPIIFLFRKLNLPSIVGFLIAGMIIGPYGFQLISEIAQIEVMAEIGVILLLFVIGLEVSFAQLMRMKKLLLIAGGLQLILTIGLGFILFYLLEIPPPQALFFAMLLSLSSTAIVLKLLSDRGELEAPHGKISLGILIFQDLAIVPMFIILPILGSGGDLSFADIALRLLTAFGAVGIILILAKFLMPKILYQLAKLRIREAFTVGILLLLLGTAYFTHSLGLSFALGAFIAGLILSESDFSHQVVAEILPLRDAFNSIFFVSIGLLLNIQFVVLFPLELTALTLAIIIIKSVIIISIVLYLKYPLRIALMTGLGLAQIGEFSFILSQQGMNYNLIGDDLYNTFLASSIFTMVLTPFLFKITPYIASKTGKLSLKTEPDYIGKKMQGHVVIVGFGLNGRNVARVLKSTGIQYLVIELNPDTVKEEKEKGENIIYGDITREEILHHAFVEEARVLVIAISDPISTRAAISNAKKLNHNIYVIVRTRYLNEINELMKLGANEVIPEEFETSLQIFAKVLERYHIPINIIMKQMQLLRGESYSLMIKEKEAEKKFIHLDEILAAGLTETFYIDSENPYIGKTLIELDLRAKTDATIIAIVRDKETITSPAGKEKLLEKDTLVITGTHKAVDGAIRYLSDN
jgi:monovalent cation:H+ antiporter-2, CPA2 family